MEAFEKTRIREESFKYGPSVAAQFLQHLETLKREKTKNGLTPLHDLMGKIRDKVFFTTNANVPSTVQVKALKDKEIVALYEHYIVSIMSTTTYLF